MTDARFKSGIPTILGFGTDVAITVGLYDIHYNPANVNLSGGGSNDLFTIIEELSHTVQFLQVWAGMKQRRIISPSVGYSHAMVQWENHYLKYSAIGLKKNGDPYENDVEKWAKNNTIDILNKLVGQTPSGNVCEFSLYPYYFSRPPYK